MSKTLPNTTDIPNIIIDEWLPHLTAEDFVVLIYICRITLSSNQPKISAEEFTQLPQHIIEETYDSLEKRGYMNELAKLIMKHEDLQR